MGKKKLPPPVIIKKADEPVYDGSRRQEANISKHREGPIPLTETKSNGLTSNTLLEIEIEETEFNTWNDSKGSLPGSRGLLTYFCHLAESGTMEKVDFCFIETLINAGADLNYTDRYGQTILHSVAKEWNVDVARFLAQKGANVHKADIHGRTPLHVAANFDYPKMIAFLLECGAHVEEKTTVEQQTPLHHACKKDAVRAIEELLKQGANLHAVDSNGRSPLFISADWGCSKAAKFLLDFGAPAGIRDNFGNPLLSSMILKMPEIANDALEQFVCSNHSLRQTSYYLWSVDTRTSKVIHAIKTKSPLEIVAIREELSVITSPAFQQLMKVKWNLFGFKHAMISLVLNFVYSILWTVLAFLFPRDEEFYFPIRSHIGRIVLESIVLLMTIYFSIKQVLTVQSKQALFNQWKSTKIRSIENEISQTHPRYPNERRLLMNELQSFRRMSKGSVFKDFWIILETIFISMVLTVYVIRGVYEYLHETSGMTAGMRRLLLGHHIAYSCLLLLIWLRMMKEFRAFSFLASFITLLSHVAADTIKFGLLFIDIYIPYVCIFYMFFGGTENDAVIVKSGDNGNYFKTISETFMTVWSMTLIADFPYAGLVAINEYLAQIIVATYWAIASLICINLYIALMSETFSRVYSNAQATASLQLASLITEIEQNLGAKEIARIDNYLKKHCNPLIIFGTDKSLGIDPLHERLTQLNHDVGRLKTKADKTFQEVGIMQESMENRIKQIKADITEIMALIQHVSDQQTEINRRISQTGFKQAGSALRNFVSKLQRSSSTQSLSYSRQSSNDESNTDADLPEKKPMLHSASSTDDMQLTRPASKASTLPANELSRPESRNSLA